MIVVHTCAAATSAREEIMPVQRFAIGAGGSVSSAKVQARRAQMTPRVSIFAIRVRSLGLRSARSLRTDAKEVEPGRGAYIEKLPARMGRTEN
jgi:hypothetical protein